jgi:hypothetical protein
MVCALILGLLAVSPAWKSPQDKGDIQAIVVKVKNSVQKNVPTKGWTSAVTNDRLRSGYQIKTEDKSYTLIQFADASKLIIRPKSIVDIKGQVDSKGRILDRSVHTTKGNIGFDVNKSDREQFRFSSPISVASIRGTRGAYISETTFQNNAELEEDRFIINRGLGSLTNLISNQTQDVGSGQTGTADSKGNLNVRQSTPQETLEGEGNEPSDDDLKKTKRQLKIPGEDREGKKRTVVLEWEE